MKKELAENLCDMCEYHDAVIKLISVDDTTEYSRYCEKCWELVEAK